MTNLGGALTVLQLRLLNRLRVDGVEHLRQLPRSGVLMVSNHHTHYMDSIAVLHTVAYLGRPYLVAPRTNLYVVAALETMKESGWLPRLMAYNGTINVKRTWKDKSGLVQRKVDPKDIDNIGVGLSDGWVLTYPQGTTKPGARGRLGVAHIIKRFRPLVVPVRLAGLREAFDKTGLRPTHLGSKLAVSYGPPLQLDYDAEPQSILQRVMESIGEG